MIRTLGREHCSASLAILVAVVSACSESAPPPLIVDLAGEHRMALLELVEMLRSDPRALASRRLSAEDLDEISGHGYLIAGKLGRVGSYLAEERLCGDAWVVNSVVAQVLAEVHGNRTRRSAALTDHHRF